MYIDIKKYCKYTQINDEMCNSQFFVVPGGAANKSYFKYIIDCSPSDYFIF